MISRRILRTARTLLSRSTRSFSLLSKPKAPASLQHIPRAGFASRIDNLLAMLDKEIKFEEDEYRSIKNKETLLDKAGFDLTENDNERLVILQKEDEKGNFIKVLFEARAPMQEDNYQNDQEGNEEQPEESLDDFMDFTVTVTQDGKTGLAAECSCFNSELTINYITSTDDIQSYVKEGKYSKSSMGYMGPEFSSLDERLQVALQEYIESLGVNDNLVGFIELYSLDKEQRLYMKWLQDVKDFVQP